MTRADARIDSGVALGHILGATTWLREQGLPDSATHLEGDVEILRAELETLRDALEQIAYGFWGDFDTAEIVAEHKAIARRALGLSEASNQETMPKEGA